MSDRNLALAIDAAVRSLNGAVHDAAKAGLTVSLDVVELNQLQGAPPTPRVNYVVMREIDLKES